ncbi:DEAD/DEAH box helicase [Maridesulfovibrio bastinii]|uniref:DEAD/DEAH box helicase n=1 Tax=Maridesulfovibrio bastinii TaxID=47157 RepID=UPI00040AD48E|nr:DEAD/DEAH box helicase [Maridesulfovibrio bastinii]
MIEFKDMGLSEVILEALESKGFSAPTPIQELTIPVLLKGEKDIIGQARTGTGKTAAFGLPIIEKIKERAGHVQAIILAPTRELACQVADELNTLKGKKRISVVSIYGGQSMMPQIRSLKRGADIVVGTPGRILDHLSRKTLKLDGISFFVLDEADEMCNMGFLEDVSKIMESASEDRHTLLFSATMPPEVQHIAEKFMGEYEKIVVKPQKDENPLTDQFFHEVNERDKFEALCRVIDAQEGFYGLVFCRTKADTDRIASLLAEKGYPADPIHGDLSQARREEILSRFKRGRCKILVATDVAARGIDVPDLTHVVNFSLPQDPESYVHRIGRTGRAGKSGVAVTIIAPHEFGRFKFITRNAGFKQVQKRPLPKVEDVIEAKKARLGAELTAIAESGKHLSYISLAEELLDGGEPVEIIATMLKRSFGNELDINSYRKIEDVKGFSQNGGGSRNARGSRVRLTAEIGRAHGMTPRKFVDMIARKARIHPVRVQNVKINGKYSTFTVPASETDGILRALNHSTRDGRPFARRRK